MTQVTNLPILYSFRRCPYAMRARMALAVSNQNCELREIVLRDKPADFLEASPSATVPTLLCRNGEVLDESLDIMLWTLRQNDPDGWMTPDVGGESEMLELITEIDGPFKTFLDNYKYSSRRTEGDAQAFAIQNRDAAMEHLTGLDVRLQNHRHLFGNRISLADVAIAPFVRQFANTDSDWFSQQRYLALHDWLDRFVSSPLFVSVMHKYGKWEPGTLGLQFPGRQAA